MAKLVVFKFEAADGASQALELVKPLQSQYMLELFDAVVVSWPKGAIKNKNATISTGGGEINSGWSFLGEMLFGLIFCAPFLGLAAGTAMGAISEKISDYGINDKFKKTVREKITEGTSAIFLLTGNSTTDKLVNALNQLTKFELILSNLSKEQEGLLRKTFA